jgi:hypothetical protein
MYAFLRKYELLSFAFVSILMIFMCIDGFHFAGFDNLKDFTGHTEVENLAYSGEDLLSEKGWFGKRKKTENPENNNLSDTILPADPIRLKLEDPDYDVRYEKGSIKPWHEIRSIYLRRQISPSNLAFISYPCAG